MMLDGNAIGGILGEVFGVEMTVAVGICGSCGAASQVAELHVYFDAPGTVVRCPSCGNVVMRIVGSEQRMWLDLSGLATLQFERPAG